MVQWDFSRNLHMFDPTKDVWKRCAPAYNCLSSIKLLWDLVYLAEVSVPPLSERDTRNVYVATNATLGTVQYIKNMLSKCSTNCFAFADNKQTVSCSLFTTKLPDASTKGHYFRQWYKMSTRTGFWLSCGNYYTCAALCRQTAELLLLWGKFRKFRLISNSQQLYSSSTESWEPETSLPWPENWPLGVPRVFPMGWWIIGLVNHR